ncbi:MAG: PIN domain-containing protein [Gemmatimonadaceae bacterium]|nr:PIN domain-containing protein [Gemmatimonadaceae bacterium]
MAFVVVYDACVLHPAPLRDLLMRIAIAGIVRARWSDTILDEVFRSITTARPDLAPDRLVRTRRAMVEAVPDCLVTAYEELAAQLDLPDPDDRHVLAAAIRAGAQVIVTYNLKDFPDHTLAKYDVEARHPDEFVLDSIDLVPGAVVRCVSEQAAALRKPPVTLPDLLDTLRGAQLVRSVARLRALMGPAALGDPT